jgi:hypothetical protein
MVNNFSPPPVPVETESKPIWASKTLWGVVLMLIPTFFPKASKILGTAENQDLLIEQGIQAIGAIVAVIGRFTAQKSLTVKKEPK